MSNNKQTMKLYTEEEIKRLLQKRIIFDDDDLDELTPIELPSDEEISKEATGLFGKTTAIYISIIQCKAFKQGAEWMRDKIQ